MKTASDLGITGDMTIDKVKAIMREHLEDGVICACCAQPTKLYSRTITSSMAAGLVLMYHKHISNPYSYFHLNEFPMIIRADMPKMRFWGLLEPKPGEKEDGNPNNGHYRITDLGIEFAKGRISIKSHVKLYNNKFFGYHPDSKDIHILSALKKKFSYSQLMEGCLVESNIK